MSGTSNKRFILIRGLSREARHWGDFPKILKGTLPNIEIETPDLPGTGKLCQKRSPIHLSKMVMALREQISPSPEPICLVGISLGGMVAVRWAMDFPQEVSGVVLLNSSFGKISPVYRRLSPFATTTLIRAAGRRDIIEREKLVMQMVSSRPKEHWDSVQNFAKFQRENPISPMVSVRQLAAAARFRAPLEAPVAKGLILVSLGDRLAHPSCSIRIHQRWGWPIRIHPTAGHDIALDEPEWVAEQIQTWRNS